jgi:hypothetical protein
MDMAIYR